MAAPTINLRDLSVLIADQNTYVSKIAHNMLRGFGTNNVVEVRHAMGAIQALSGQKIDVMLCDAHLPPHGGLSLIRAIRRKTDNENRTLPILLMSADTRELAIRQARDAGANMVIAKPMSPAGLYDRLAWLALTPRQFVDASAYFGPDRRFKAERHQGNRRKDDNDIVIAEASDASPVQADSLLGAGRTGRD